MSTANNLKEAFAGESQANRRYRAFAKKAEEEGYSQAAKLFRAAAHAETVHALEHLKVMREVGSTEENLRAAFEGENYEFRTMYPSFISKAQEEGNKAAARSFYNANEVEKIHSILFKKALEELGQNEEVDYYVCPVCGNTVEGPLSGNCPICSTPGSRFVKVG